MDEEDYMEKIRLLSKAERQLTENSAIARESKIMYLSQFNVVGRKLAIFLRLIDNFDLLLLDFDGDTSRVN